MCNCLYECVWLCLPLEPCTAVRGRETTSTVFICLFFSSPFFFLSCFYFCPWYADDDERAHCGRQLMASAFLLFSFACSCAASLTLSLSLSPFLLRIVRLADVKYLKISRLNLTTISTYTATINYILWRWLKKKTLHRVTI